MENASKATIIIGAVIVTVLIISAALYLYSSSQGLLKTTGENISDQEKLAFNQQWTYYDGEQLGDSVKDLLRKLMQNCSRNSTEQSRLVGLKIQVRKGADGLPENTDISIKVNESDKLELTGPDPESTYYNLKFTTGVLNPNEAKTVYSWIRSAIETRHVYKISQEFASNGLINKIIIDY